MFTIPMGFFKILISGGDGSGGDGSGGDDGNTINRPWTLKYIYGTSDVSRGTYNLKGNSPNPNEAVNP